MTHEPQLALTVSRAQMLWTPGNLSEPAACDCVVSLSCVGHLTERPGLCEYLCTQKGGRSLPWGMGWEVVGVLKVTTSPD